MSIEDQLRNLILSKYRSIAVFTEVAGIRYTTMMSILNRGVNNASISNIITVCQELGISADELAKGNIVFLPEKSDPTLESLFSSVSSEIIPGSLKFNDIPLSEYEASYVLDSLTVIQEIIKRKRARF